MDLTLCPECGGLAEVQWRDVVGSTDVRNEAGEILFAAGDTITIDGTTGEVWLGAAEQGGAADLSDDEIVERDLPELALLLGTSTTPAG